MDFNTRLRRVTDLFVEGTEAYLGDDDEGKPVVVWVNKLNSFEVEEARRDGIVQRGMRLAQLGREDNPERQALLAEMRVWNDEQLRNAWVSQKGEEIYLDVINDIEASEEWREKIDQIRRLPQLLDDAEAGDDDPRRDQLVGLQTEYLDAIRRGQQEKHKEAMTEAADISRDDLEKSYVEQWRQRQTIDEFMEARRITEFYIAMRECVATDVGMDPAGGRLWDHTECDHNNRLLAARAQVKSLPGSVIEKIADALDKVTVTQREAGNWDAPRSSSESSEQSNEPEEPSTHSSLTVTPVESLMS